MCGIFGVFTDYSNGFSQKQMDVLGQSIVINQFRGIDSTGLFAVDNDGKSELLKVLGGAGHLFAADQWEDIKKFISQKAKIVVGHGRAATRGTVKIENAHPFAKNFDTGERLKLVHNGTLEASQDLPDFDKFDVDSEWIAEMLVRYGPKEALPKIRGAMALVWWNEKDKTINFFRNNQRPLHFNKYEGTYEKSFVLASEAAAVKFLAERNGLKTEKKEDAGVYYFSPQIHYALSLDDLFGGWAIHDKLDEPKARVVHHLPHYPEYNLPARPRTETGGSWSGSYRNYQYDLERLKNGVYRSVEFDVDDGGTTKRTTTFGAGGILIDTVNGPYIPYLTSMKRAKLDVGNTGDKWWVEITYWSPALGKETKTWMAAEADENLPAWAREADEEAEKETPKGSPKSSTPKDWNHDKFYLEFAPVGAQKFIPNRKLRWTSRSHTDTIRHKAIIASEGGPALRSYSNNYDGEIKPGDQVVMEVDAFESVIIGGQKWWRFDGTRATSRQDRCIDFSCLIKAGTDEAIDLIGAKESERPFIAGTIRRLSIAAKETYDETGAYCVAYLDEIELIHPEESQNETSAAA